MTPFRISLPATRESVDEARTALLDHLAPAALSPRLVFRIEVVLEEVLMNIAWHAYAEGARSPSMTVSASIDGADAELMFEDEGAAFDPTAATAPELPSSIEQARVGGLGLTLLRKYARCVRYERDGTTNRLTVRIPKEG